ncbi:MAG: restriction endonuclease subunit S [Prolixibacteraceae bacterium]|nr:restriction endonuclease subunit S [Prolixibacteraceae bacterium]
MKTTLEHIASISTGVFAKPVAEGEIVYLQARHFDENGLLISELHPDLMADEISEKHFLKSGDVLFAAKGNKNFATVFEDQYPRSVASTSFFVIRLRNSKILPDYFALFMNSPKTQLFLKSTALGSSIASISKAVLEKLEISIPNIQTQRVILEISRLRSQEKEIRQKIESLQEIIIQQKINNAIK